MGIFDFGTSLKEEVIDCLQDFKLRKSELTTEKSVENKVAAHLRTHFEDVHQQYHVEGFLGLKVDIDIRTEVGIELKLAKDLKSAASIQRLFGQVIYYSHKKYESDLIVFIVGTAEERREPMLKEVMDFLEELDVYVVFSKVKKNK